MSGSASGELTSDMLEDYLLECIDSLDKAGTDPQRRKKAVQRPKAWALLPNEWRALALLAASKASVDAPSIEVGGNAGRSRIGRRGGRGRVRSTENWLSSPAEALASEWSSAYRLAVLLVHHNRGEEWESSLDSHVDSLRKECASGIHPVWEALAKEAPILAELSRFLVIEVKGPEMDAESWIELSRIDPQDHLHVKDWLSLGLPFRTDSEQDHALHEIRRDLADGKPRMKMWMRKMKPSLRGLRAEGALLEGILLAANSSDQALQVFESIEGGCLGEVAEQQAQLIRIRSGEMTCWRVCALSDGDDGLSRAMRLAAWKESVHYRGDLTAEELLRGAAIIGEVGERLPNPLLWELAGKLVLEERIDEAAEIVKDVEIENPEHVSTALVLLSSCKSDSISEAVVSSIPNMSEEGVVSVITGEGVSIDTRVKAARELLNRDSIRHTDAVLNTFVEAADIDGMMAVFQESPSLAKVYPQRILLCWHLNSGGDMANQKSLATLRKIALSSIGNSTKDPYLSETSIALISLLDGLAQEVESIHEKLDSDGLRSLNEVRRALSVEGDRVVSETSINNLQESLGKASLTTLERRLFGALIVSLQLNRSAMNLQIGTTERTEDAIISLSNLSWEDGVTMKTVGTVTDLVVEYNIGVPALESWYRQHANGSPELQVVRAAILREKGDRLNAARAYKDAARKLGDDFEKSSLVMRKALIEFAHSAGWREAVSIIDSNPALASTVTNRFKLYLRTGDHHDAKRRDRASSELLAFAAEQQVSKGEGSTSISEGRGIVLDTLLRYPEEHGLPSEPFIGRVRAAMKDLEWVKTDRQSDVERRVLFELKGRRDPAVVAKMAMDISEKDPLGGIRVLEKAIYSGLLEDKQSETLKKSQRALFASHSSIIPVKERRTLKGLSLKPLIIVDTNILIEALKDDLLRELSVDNLGSLDWTVERAFHWMLRRRAEEGRVVLHVPPAAEGEFIHRARSPESVLELFSDIYIDKSVWENRVNGEFLAKRARAILATFDTWGKGASGGDFVALDEFLLKHRDVFYLIDEQKRRIGDAPARTSINGDEIYPEKGDRDIMSDAASIASTCHADIGSVLVATRDSDFRLVSRALEEEFGFGVIGDAQQLNSRVL